MRQWAQDAQPGDDAWQPNATTPPAPTALHASLDSTAKRRLQMIEAMAGFSGESASMLELQPQRRIDAKTYELLTAVSLTPRSAA
jgi:hypothetical protein